MRVPRPGALAALPPMLPMLPLTLALMLAGCRADAPVLAGGSGGIGIQAAADGAPGCAAPPLPDLAALPAQPGLPDPFAFGDGRRAATRADWTCRRTQLAAQIQHYELGPIPGPERVQASVGGSGLDRTLSLRIAHAGKTVEIPVRIRLPAGGSPPYPALIGLGAVTLNNDALARMGVALVSFPNGLVAEQKDGGSRGKGGFYDLYGQAHPAGAMSAWAWGVSRLVDALEATPAAGIDAGRLGVTGCSRNGKGAIVAGAFDTRLKLTIAQESGSGGAAGWRVSDAQLAAGEKVQTLGQIVTENVWFRDGFRQFGDHAQQLPFDQHEVMGLIAPRALLVVENTSMAWLGNRSAWVTSLAARETWKALGAAEAMGIAQVGGHPHCQLPVSQHAAVNAFVRRFLLDDKSARTEVVETDGGFGQDPAPWVAWSTPALR
jgi:hypothetical protein